MHTHSMEDLPCWLRLSWADYRVEFLNPDNRATQGRRSLMIAEHREDLSKQIEEH